jgi:hypothetical protein
LRLTPLLGALLLALSLPAWAGDSAAHDELAATASLQTGALAMLRSLHTRSVRHGEGPRPTPLHPYQGLSATAYPLARLGFWAQGEGYSLSRRTSLYDIEGGAVLRLDGGVRVTASYRLLGADFGFDSDIERADVEPGIAAPFLGVAFDF